MVVLFPHHLRLAALVATAPLSHPLLVASPAAPVSRTLLPDPLKDRLLLPILLMRVTTRRMTTMTMMTTRMMLKMRRAATRFAVEAMLRHLAAQPARKR